MGHLTYVVMRRAGQPYEFCEERYTIHGAQRQKVIKGLVLYASILFGKTPERLAAFRDFFFELMQLEEINRANGAMLLPVAMTDTSYPMMRARLDCRLAQYAAGVVSTDELFRTYQEEFACLTELRHDELKLLDSDGRYMVWDQEGKMQLDLCEEELNGDDFHLVETSDEQKNQLAALGLKDFYWQCSMNPDGTPTGDDLEHQTYGTITEDGEFIPVVTILDWSHPAIVRKEPSPDE